EGISPAVVDRAPPADGIEPGLWGAGGGEGVGSPDMQRGTNDGDRREGRDVSVHRPAALVPGDQVRAGSTISRHQTRYDPNSRILRPQYGQVRLASRIGGCSRSQPGQV